MWTSCKVGLYVVLMVQEYGYRVNPIVYHKRIAMLQCSCRTGNLSVKFNIVDSFVLFRLSALLIYNYLFPSSVWVFGRPSVSPTSQNLCLRKRPC
jgi:hypothetical protein